MLLEAIGKTTLYAEVPVRTMYYIIHKSDKVISFLLETRKGSIAVDFNIHMHTYTPRTYHAQYGCKSESESQQSDAPMIKLNSSQQC